MGVGAYFAFAMERSSRLFSAGSRGLSFAFFRIWAKWQGRTSSSTGWGMFIRFSTSSSRSSFSGEGFSCTRYTKGMDFSRATRAADSLARSMNSSISSSLRPLVLGCTSTQTPSSLRISLLSGASREGAPRRSRSASRLSASSFISSRDSVTSAYFSAISGVWVPARMVLISLYTPLTRERITDLWKE